MHGELGISLDKLPIKRLDTIDENGFECFPSDVGYEEKRVNLIRRIDFSWAVEREDSRKKQKKGEGTTSAKEGSTTNQQSRQWQSLVENLQLAHQELSVIIDLINTVEANDAVTVSGMTRPKQLPNELLSDLGVSTATKLQCFRHLGKYFKQSAKALSEQVARETRFYGALIRLQQNWKVKRHRLAATTAGNEGFYIDLCDNSINDSAGVIRPASTYTIFVERDAAGMLSVNLPPDCCQSLQFEILGFTHAYNMRKSRMGKAQSLMDGPSSKIEKEQLDDEDEYVKGIHSTLGEVHRAMHDEQVFELVNREACNPSLGVNVTGIKQNYLRLSIGQGASLSISLVSTGEDGQTDGALGANPTEASSLRLGSVDGMSGGGIEKTEKLGIQEQVGFEIYLRQLFHEYVFVKAKDKATSSLRSQILGQQLKENSNVLGHFCMSLAHRIFSNKVLTVLENLVCRTPYVNLVSHPTWHSRTSSWVLSMKVPQSILHAGRQMPTSGLDNVKSIGCQFWTKIVVIDDSIKVGGEGAPNVISLFNQMSEGVHTVSGYDCDLGDLPIILLQQVASQIIQWLHEEALIVGIKAKRDFLSLAFELDQGELVKLVAHVDPEDSQGCISWWLILDDGMIEEHRLHSNIPTGESAHRKFLGYLSLDVLYSTLLDFQNLCSC